MTIARWVAGGVQHDALLRPDPRHRHPHQARRSTACCATSPRPAPPSSSTPPNWRRSSSSATASSSSSAAEVVDELPAADRRRGAPCLRAAHSLPTRRGRADRGTDRRQAGVAGGGRGWRWAPRLLRLLLALRSLLGLRGDPARATRAPRRLQACDRQRCPSPSPPSPRRSWSSPAASTCRSAAMMALTSVTAAPRWTAPAPSSPSSSSSSSSLLGLVLGALNGLLIVVTRVPDIVVTLAMLFVWPARPPRPRPPPAAPRTG